MNLPIDFTPDRAEPVEIRHSVLSDEDRARVLRLAKDDDRDPIQRFAESRWYWPIAMVLWLAAIGLLWLALK